MSKQDVVNFFLIMIFLSGLVLFFLAAYEIMNMYGIGADNS